MTDALDFLLEASFGSLPPAVVAQTKRCLLDLIGVAAAGRQTALAAIACDFAARHLGAASADWSARLLLDGRPASAPGAAFAGAAIIDSFDAHDGHALTKGHAGVAVFPAALAFHQLRPAPDGRSFLADLAVGYELAIRAGIALHATAADYHTSGAWNALACAAHRRAPARPVSRRDAPRPRHRRVPRPSQPHDALHRPPHDGQGRLGSRSARRRLRRASRRRRIHGRARPADGGPAHARPVGRPRRAVAHPRALLQAAPRLPLGPAGHGGGLVAAAASTGSPPPPSAPSRSKPSRRRHGSRRGAPKRRRKRSTACPTLWRRPWSAARSEQPSSGPSRTRRSAASPTR